MSPGVAVANCALMQYHAGDLRDLYEAWMGRPREGRARYVQDRGAQDVGLYDAFAAVQGCPERGRPEGGGQAIRKYLLSSNVTFADQRVIAVVPILRSRKLRKALRLVPALTCTAEPT